MRKKQLLCYVALVALTAVKVVGANPFLPGVVAILGSEALPAPLLFLSMGLGLSMFVPYVVGVKYLAIGGAILMGEFLIRRNRGAVSTPVCGILAGVCVTLVGMAGEWFHISRYGACVIGLEAAFTMGTVFCFKELAHGMLTDRRSLFTTCRVAPAPKDGRLKGYVRAVEKMADSLHPATKTCLASCSELEKEGTTVVQEGLRAIAGALNQCLKEREFSCPDKAGEIRRLEFLLWEKGVKSSRYSYLEDEEGRGMLLLYAGAKKPNQISKKAVARMAQQVFGTSFLVAEEGEPYLTDKEQELLLRERGRFTVRFFAEGESKEYSEPCGDNFSVLRREDGKTFVMLSDGLGSGQTACRQSERVLELIEELLSAGFSAADALNMSNGCLAGQSEEGFLATVDLCEIDEFTGEALFYKMGAPASFVIHKNQVDKIDQPEERALPAGAFAQSPGVPAAKKLYHGDYLIMASDGVLDALAGDDPEEAMRQLLIMLPKGNPGAMAEQILKIVKETKGERADDCMVLVAGIRER